MPVLCVAGLCSVSSVVCCGINRSLLLLVGPSGTVRLDLECRQRRHVSVFSQKVKCVDFNVWRPQTKRSRSPVLTSQQNTSHALLKTSHMSQPTKSQLALHQSLKI